MTEASEILQELKELDSLLANFSRAMPFAVPDNYFKTLSEDLLEDIHAAEGPETLLEFSGATPFEVPDRYLNNLPQVLSDAALINASEFPLEAPPGYINALPNALLQHVKAKELPGQGTKTISLLPQFRRRVIGWAAAAVLLLGISVGSYRYLNLKSSPDSVASAQLLQLDGQDLDGYVEQRLDEFDSETVESEITASNTDLQTSLSGVDEQEIQNYLDQPVNETSQNLN